MMSSPNSPDSNTRGRPAKAVPENRKARRRNGKAKAAQSSSFHGVPSSQSQSQTAARDNGGNRHSKSFRSPLDRIGGVPLDVLLGGGDDGGCPHTIEAMRLASKALERRAAELECERLKVKSGRGEASSDEQGEVGGGRHDSLKERYSAEEGENTGTSREDVAVFKERRTRRSSREMNKRSKSFTTRPSHAGVHEEKLRQHSHNHNQSMPVLPGVDEGSGGSSEMEAKRDSAANKRCPFSIDQVAEPHQMDESSTSTEHLIKIARLREGDGAWVRRSNGVWTYATLQRRSNGDGAHLVFIVNAKGSTKKFPVTQWADHVRMVAENVDQADAADDEDDELDLMMSTSDLRPTKSVPTVKDGDEIDLMMSTSDVQLMKSVPTARKRTSSGGGEDASRSGQQRTTKTSASTATARSNDSSSSGSTCETDGDGIQWGCSVPLDILGVQDNYRRPVADYQVSMHTLGDDLDESDSSLPPALKTALNKGAAEGRKKNLHVSWVRSSFTSTPESSLSGCHLICTEETRLRDTSIPPRPPSIRENRKEQKELTQRPVQQTRRGSWGSDDQVIEEVKAGMNKLNMDGPKPKVSAVRKKKLKELDMGAAIPEHHRQIKQESFYSALKSINKRSSVMIPPTSKVSVHLG